MDVTIFEVLILIAAFRLSETVIAGIVGIIKHHRRCDGWKTGRCVDEPRD